MDAGYERCWRDDVGVGEAGDVGGGLKVRVLVVAERGEYTLEDCRIELAWSP